MFTQCIWNICSTNIYWLTIHIIWACKHETLSVSHELCNKLIPRFSSIEVPSKKLAALTFSNQIWVSTLQIWKVTDAKNVLLENILVKISTFPIFTSFLCSFGVLVLEAFQIEYFSFLCNTIWWQFDCSQTDDQILWHSKNCQESK